MDCFHLNRRLRTWLGSGAAGSDGPDWDGWILRQMSRGEVVTVGGMLVDRALLRQRFACVPERCAPLEGRGPWRSCCADVGVALDLGERRRAAAGARSLGLARFEEAGMLARPGGACIFSRLDHAGRIRCRLRDVARARGEDQSEVQPLSCRLFPLVVLDLGEGRTALTLVSRATWRLLGAHPPHRYPCLSDGGLPPLYRSMRRELDWAFGVGFARALSRRGV